MHSNQNASAGTSHETYNFLMKLACVFIVAAYGFFHGSILWMNKQLHDNGMHTWRYKIFTFQQRFGVAIEDEKYRYNQFYNVFQFTLWSLVSLFLLAYGFK